MEVIPLSDQRKKLVHAEVCWANSQLHTSGKVPTPWLPVTLCHMPRFSASPLFW
jgi:hypothetical protein